MNEILAVSSNHQVSLAEDESLPSSSSGVEVADPGSIQNSNKEVIKQLFQIKYLYLILLSLMNYLSLHQA